ncbi:MAG: hypothetical protein Q4D38_08085 [Planctomycetia bacterium]|nr:hypothetical protein [Planctomycetia bacterium]
MPTSERELRWSALLEYAEAGEQHIDRGRSLLRGVKILGLVSTNKRRYTEKAVAQAMDLYEGVKVNVNHPQGNPQTPRDYRDRIGWLENIVYRESVGLFGDFRFNPKHPLADQLMWDAENAPKNVGFSHNIMAQTETNDEGVLLIKEISQVKSVDLVADPATTEGLFESESDIQNNSNCEKNTNKSECTINSKHTQEEKLEMLRHMIEALERRVKILTEESSSDSPLSRPKTPLSELNHISVDEFVKTICR